MTSFAHILRDLSTLSSIRSSLPPDSNLTGPYNDLITAKLDSLLQHRGHKKGHQMISLDETHDLLFLRQSLETLNIDTKSTLDIILRDYEGLLQKEYGKRVEFDVEDLWELADLRRLLSRQSPVMGPGWDLLASIEEKGVLSVLEHMKRVGMKQEMSIDRIMHPA